MSIELRGMGFGPLNGLRLHFVMRHYGNALCHNSGLCHFEKFLKKYEHTIV
jgi:hypothetical protein